MKRGELWTVAGGSSYTGKPRPAVLLQDDRFDATDSITLCVFTTDPEPASFIRILVEPSRLNGLEAPSWIMVDKIATVPRARLGKRIGRLDEDAISALERAVLTFLGLAGRYQPSNVTEPG